MNSDPDPFDIDFDDIGEAPASALHTAKKFKSDVSANAPHSVECERGLLAICLMEGVGRGYFAECQAAGISADYFFKTSHQTIFSALEKIHASGNELDEIILLEELRKNGNEEEVGGVAAIYVIQDQVETPVQGKFFAKVVREKYLSRVILRKSREVTERISDGEDPGEVIEDLRAFTEEARDITTLDLVDRLQGLRFKAELTPPEDRVILRLGENYEVGTEGNIVAILAHLKGGKTGFVSGGIASCLERGRFLFWQSPSPDGAVVVFDTEQSESDFHKTESRALSRIGSNGKTPPRLHAYRIRDLNSRERRSAIRQAMKLAQKESGSIHSVWIDGVADLVSSVNDEEESNGLIDEMLALSTEFKTVLVCVLHLNPGSSEKSRGHLGSQLERKAESNLMLAKDENEVTSIWSEKMRRACIPKNAPLCFKWDPDLGRHEECDPSERQSSKSAKMDIDQAVEMGRSLALNKAWKLDDWKQELSKQTGRRGKDYFKDAKSYALADERISEEIAQCGQRKYYLIGPIDAVQSEKILLLDRHEKSRQKELSSQR